MKPSAQLAILATAISPASAFFLVPCWPLTSQRIDPIVSPGEVASHGHQVIGGKAFAPVMKYSDTQAADCTTCMVSKDKSNYWIPLLYYKHADGSFERVKQVGSTSVYYFNEESRLGPGEKLESFPAGLRMLAGDPNKRADDGNPETQALNYKCLNYNGQPSDHRGFPTIDCPDGFRAEVTFPSCWDGANLDSKDHKSHMAYPTGSFESGACPPSHPHHVPTMKVEFIFDTHSFAGWSENPFVWSNGDPTGYGLHADYLMGWDKDVLDNAVANCHDPNGVIQNCPAFQGYLPESQQYVDPGTCKVDSFVNEDIGGTIGALPGCNTLSFGPAPAAKQACNAVANLIGDWSSGVQQAGGAVNSIIGGGSGGSSGDNSAGPSVSAGNFFAASQQTTAAAPPPSTTPSPPPPPPPPTTTPSPPPPPPPPTTTEVIKIVTDYVYVTEYKTEYVNAIATEYVAEKKHRRHQHGGAHKRPHF